MEQCTFLIDPGRRERMRKVMGAVGYSLCLRSSEHVARYVYSGTWLCTQMLPRGRLSVAFQGHETERLKKFRNQMPPELVVEHTPKLLHPKEKGFLELTPQAIDLVKQWLEVNATIIDMVVIVVSGRIEQVHASSITQMMDWLHFGSYPFNFLFVYNKADTVRDESTLQSNVFTMSEMLETGFKQIKLYSEGEARLHNLNISLGIPPDAKPAESKAAMEELLRTVFVRKYGPPRGRALRVPVDTSSCLIL
mmetsp:Transcript_19117/g.45009  ORF Transcript_19117/g.45009 Transcript_19117/m.45009 type:complete len:250 (+) Transcript_19117:309-1058(+)